MQIVRERGLADGVTVLRRDNPTAAVDFKAPIKKVAAYCRVSTDLDIQESSLELQMEAYNNIILEHPGLRAYDVEVRFDKEGISSFDRSTEMILNMMAMCAEYESKSISQNTRWALQKQAEKGIRHIGCKKVLGYDEIDGVYVPTKDAKTIRIIFESYANGMTLVEISKHLQDLGVKTLNGNSKFNTGVISYILSNEIYVGDRLIQKQAPRDFYTKKPDTLKEYESIYVKDHHEAIIPRELWGKVQEIRILKKHKTYAHR